MVDTVTMMGFISLLMAFLCSSANAADCTTVNLYENINSPLTQIPIEIQRAGTCYAYSSSTLINYQLASEGIDFKDVSPLWMAYVFSKKFKPGANTISSGDESQAVQSLQQMGLCPKSVMEQALAPFYNKVPPEGMLNNFEKTLRVLDIRFNKNDSCEVSPSNLYTVQADHPSCRPPEEFLNVDKFSDHFSHVLQNYDYMPILDKLFAACKGKTTKLGYQQAGIRWVNSKDKKVNEFQNLVSEVLKVNKRPMTIGTCLNLFHDPDYVKDAKCRKHSTVVVGSRMMSGKCQLLIRDSNVLYQEDDLQSHGKNPWEQHRDEKGKILGMWIDQDKIFNTLQDAFYLP